MPDSILGKFYPTDKFAPKSESPNAFNGGANNKGLPNGFWTHKNATTATSTSSYRAESPKGLSPKTSNHNLGL